MRRFTVGLVLLIAALSIFGVSVAGATKPPSHMVRICHARPADTAANGWVIINVDIASSGYQHSGHADQHDADVIPPYQYQQFSFAGKNWDTEGQAVWNNGCKLPVPTTTTSTVPETTTSTVVETTTTTTVAEEPTTTTTIADDAETTTTTTVADIPTTLPERESTTTTSTVAEVPKTTTWPEPVSDDGPPPSKVASSIEPSVGQPSTTQRPPSSTPPVQVTELPRTGSDTAPLLLLSAIMFICGATLLINNRRR